jgi:hypothetical protein
LILQGLYVYRRLVKGYGGYSISTILLERAMEGISIYNIFSQFVLEDQNIFSFSIAQQIGRFFTLCKWCKIPEISVSHIPLNQGLEWG